jgi:hypothetical protein
MTFKRRGGRKPVEGAADDGACRSAAEIAKAERVTRGFINRLLRLTLLAPDVVEGILAKALRVFSRDVFIASNSTKLSGGKRRPIGPTGSSASKERSDELEPHATREISMNENHRLVAATPLRIVQLDSADIDEHASSPPAVLCLAPESVEGRCRQPHPQTCSGAGLTTAVPSAGNESRCAHE